MGNRRLSIIITLVCVCGPLLIASNSKPTFAVASERIKIVWKDTIRENVEQFSGHGMFLSCCGPADGKKLILLDPIRRQGILIEEENRRVVNVVELYIDDQGIGTGELLGGLASHRRMELWLPEMLKLPFRWAEAGQAMSILESTTHPVCPESKDVQ